MPETLVMHYNYKQSAYDDRELLYCLKLFRTEQLPDRSIPTTHLYDNYSAGSPKCTPVELMPLVSYIYLTVSRGKIWTVDTNY